MKVLLTGASGFLGSHIAEGMAAEGHELRLLLRQTSRRGFLDGVTYEQVVGDVRNAASLFEAMRGVDAVVHAAGLTSALTEEEYRAVNEAGTAAAVEAALRAGVSRFVYVSSLAAQGPSADGSSKEPNEAEPRPLTPYGRSKLAGEAHVLQGGAAMSVSVIRPPVIYGPRDGGLLPFFRLVNLRIMPLYGSGANRISWVHVHDAASAIVQTALAREPSGSIYTISDGGAYSWNDLVDILAGALGRRPLRLKVPAPLYAGAGMAADLAARAMRRPFPLNGDRVRDFAQAAWICGHETITRELGWTPAYDALKGISQTVAWYRENGWL